MNNIVAIEKQELITNTLIIAESVGYEHRSILKLIKEHEQEFKDFGTLALGVRKSKGRPTNFYLLTESQSYYLMTLMQNKPKVSEFKKALVKEFVRMRKALLKVQANHQNEQWKQARLDGKAVRMNSTDVIKEFVEYAVKQGSKNAVRYYSNITNMENKALFIMEQKFENVREMLDGQQLSTLKVADKMVADTLQEGMERSMHYKDIYQLAKERIEQFASLVKPSIVISQTELKLIGGK